MAWADAAEQFTNALASSDPTPGGGAAAATSGAMGCALALMAIRTTLKRKSTPADFLPALQQAEQQFSALYIILQKLARQDAQAYAAYIEACKLPKENPTRAQAMQAALWQAALVPADTAVACAHALQAVAEIQEKIAPVIMSDLLCARHLLQGATACCVENLRANATYITDPERTKQLTKLVETYESNGK